jgi:hypothetical protein
MATRWQYRVADLGFEELEEKLNGWGVRGWEIVAVTSVVVTAPVQSPSGGFAMAPITSFQVVAKKAIDDHPEPSSPQSSPA